MFPINPLAKYILEDRYLWRNTDGSQETPEDMLHRVASTLASCEKDNDYWKKKFFSLMADGLFLINTPALFNAGIEGSNLYSACFTLGIEDSISDIFNAVSLAANIFQSGGGVGYNFSRIRPKGSLVASSGGTASGPVSFMRVFDTMTDVIKQAGRRRGANMATLMVHHPEIREFIQCKEQEGEYSNFNLSVMITDEFMEALKGSHGVSLYHPSEMYSGKPQEEWHTFTVVSASEIMDLICEGMWKNGEPGIIFIDEMNRKHPLPDLVETVNPCSESVLLPGESCVLGSINLAKALNPEIDFEDVIYTAMRMLDNVHDTQRYPNDEIRKVSRENRKVGLGIMGLHEWLIQQGIPYASEQALSKVNVLMLDFDKAAKKATERLAEEKGPFPRFKDSFWKTPRRNCSVTTVAPTGSLSLILGTSAGIEPVFELIGKKLYKDEQVDFIFEPFRQFLDGLHEEKRRRVQQWVEDHGSVQNCPFLDHTERSLWALGREIDWRWHLKMQGIVQQHIEMSISKTINLPENTPKEDIYSIVLEAHRLGIKSLTVYRDGSRTSQVYSSDRTPEGVLSGQTGRVITGCGKIYVTLNEENGRPTEVFLKKGKTGGCKNCFMEALGRTSSIYLQSGGSLDHLIKQLENIKCHRPKAGSPTIHSCPDGIAHELRRMSGKTKDEDTLSYTLDCPKCESHMTRTQGCWRCPACGYSECGG